MEPEKIAKEPIWKNQKNILIFSGIVLLAAVVIVSILRERIVSENMETTTVVGRGKISYQPDIAVVNLGVQIDKANKAEEALNRLNETMNKVIDCAKTLGIPEEDIQTQSYSLFPHYDYLGEGGGTSLPSGYDANQQVAIKVRGVDQSPEFPGKIIEEASKAGANQVVGVNFDISNLEELKQKARIAAIKDAKSKTAELAKAAGVRLGKMSGWYESVIKSPDSQNYYGGMGGSAEKGSSLNPQISGGTQEIIIEMGLNYKVK